MSSQLEVTRDDVSGPVPSDIIERHLDDTAQLADPRRPALRRAHEYARALDLSGQVSARGPDIVAGCCIHLAIHDTQSETRGDNSVAKAAELVDVGPRSLRQALDSIAIALDEQDRRNRGDRR